MSSIRKQFAAKGFDETDWQKHFHQCQQEYIRTKLRCIQLYAAGKSTKDIMSDLGISLKSIRTYIRLYIQLGLATITKPVKRPQSSLLTQTQQSDFKTVLLTSCPQDYGLVGRIWTGSTMQQYLKNTYQIDYKSGIYDLLERLNLSHQKAHADYLNAKPEEQQAFLKEFTHILLKADGQTAVVAYDEFSVCEKPSSYYGWAEKNTRPAIKTNEKKD